MQKHPTIQRLGLFAGLLLIIGFIFPVFFPFGRDKITFPNIELMFEDMLPFSLRLYMFFPVIGAILCFVARAQGKSMTRAIFYLVAGYFPWLLELAMGSEMTEAGGMGATMFGGGILNMSTFVSTMFNFGLIGLIVGAFSGEINRSSRIAPYFALAGGGLVALALVFPVGGLGEYGGYSILLILPFKLLSEMPLVSLGLLIFYGLLIPACIFGIVWGIQHQNGVNHSKRIKSFLGGAFIWMAIFIFISMFVNVVERVDDFAFAVPMLATLYIKMIGMFVGPFLAKCCGLIEIVSHVGYNPDAGDGRLKMNPNPSHNPFDTGHANPFDVSNQTAFGDGPSNTSSKGGQDQIV